MLRELAKCLSHQGNFASIRRTFVKKKHFNIGRTQLETTCSLKNYISYLTHKMFSVLWELFLPLLVGSRLCQNLHYEVLKSECLANDEMKIIWKEAAVGYQTGYSEIWKIWISNFTGKSSCALKPIFLMSLLKIILIGCVILHKYSRRQ
jgi:hypothetical protein